MPNWNWNMWESREFSIWSFCIWRINMSRESVIGAGWHCEPLLCECLSSAAGFKMWELVRLCYKLSLPGIQQDFQILTVTWLQLCLVLCDFKSKKWDDGADEEEVFWPVLCLSQVKEMWMFWLTSCVTSKRFKKKTKKQALTIRSVNFFLCLRIFFNVSCVVPKCEHLEIQ